MRTLTTFSLRTAAVALLATVGAASGNLSAQSAGPGKPPARGWGSSWAQPSSEEERDTRKFNELLAAAEKTRDYRALFAESERQVKAHPEQCDSYVRRGIAYNGLRQRDRARADQTRALEIARKYHLRHAQAVALFNRAYPSEIEGKWDAAVADLRASIKCDSQYALAIGSLAWLRATCPDKRYRSGIEAVDLAHRACALTNQAPGHLDNLAAAYAEKGDFSRAIEEQRRAIVFYRQRGQSRNEDVNFEKEAAKHLTRYQAHKPFREDYHDQQ